MNEKHGQFLRTAAIFELECPYDNMYQGNASRYLFVCSAGLLRSPTAAKVAMELGYNARSCGSADYALIPISVNLIHWANKIFFVEEANYLQAEETFFGDRPTLALLRTKSKVWEVEDYFDYNDYTLRGKVKELLT
jgi:predicted protein tyrosine phosphatase